MKEGLEFISNMDRGVSGMMRDETLTILAKAAGYALIPPQEIFAVSEETPLTSEEKLPAEKNSLLFSSKVKKWFLSSPNDEKNPSLRKHLISWIQNLVHV